MGTRRQYARRRGGYLSGVIGPRILILLIPLILTVFTPLYSQHTCRIPQQLCMCVCMEEIDRCRCV